MSDPEAKPTPRETFTLLDLSLEHIGPFDRAKLTFYDREDAEPEVPVTILTGDNGAGKSIVVDAIRAVFGPHYALLARPIWQLDRTDGHCRTERRDPEPRGRVGRFRKGHFAEVPSL